jgi:hypothetical protein
LAADVAQAELHGASHRARTAAGRATHAAGAVVEPEAVPLRTVHEEHRCHARRGGGESEQVELGARDRLERGDHIRERRRFDAGHRGVDRRLLHRGGAVRRGERADDVVGVVGRGFEELEDALLGRREHGQPIAPAVGERAFVQREGIRIEVDTLTRE